MSKEQQSNSERDLDHRLREAHQHQLANTREHLGAVEFRGHGPARALGPRLLVAAAVLLVLGIGSIAVLRLAANNDPNISATEAPEPTDLTTTTTPQPPETDPPSMNISNEDSVTTTSMAPSGDSNNSEPTTPENSTTTTTGSNDPDITTVETALETIPPQTTTTVITAPGVANNVCPTGLRAQLERASLSYVGENQGWGRLADLVDEQDGPHYFEAWEPGYANTVTVLVQLEEPVIASEIRLAQDPFTPVSGTITVEALGRRFPIVLEGTDGWVVADFSPQILDSFTITRSEAQSNVMEVLVCVEQGAG